MHERGLTKLLGKNLGEKRRTNCQNDYAVIQG